MEKEKQPPHTVNRKNMGGLDVEETRPGGRGERARLDRQGGPGR